MGSFLKQTPFLQKNKEQACLNLKTKWEGLLKPVRPIYSIVFKAEAGKKLIIRHILSQIARQLF